MKYLVILASLGVLAAATHANVMHAGGYESDGAPLAITLSALLAVGIAYATMAWRGGSRGLGLLLGVCIFAGEAYWLLVNAERELAAREALELPARDLAAKWQDARDRLVKAEKAKDKAESNIIDQAALPGCAKNCAALLSAAKLDAIAELDAARNAIAALPPEVSSSPLSERIGVAPWLWDLILAGLRSLAVVGASVALALALHPMRNPQTALAVMAQEHPQTDSIAHRGSVALYLKETIEPAEGGRVPIAELISRYNFWCEKAGAQPLEKQILAKEIARLFKKAGLETEIEAGKLYGVGARLSA